MHVRPAHARRASERASNMDEQASGKIGHDKRFVAKRQWDVKALWERHHEIIRQVVLGRTNNEIAMELQCTPQTVSNIRNAPLARQEIERLSEQRDEATVDIAKRIEEFAPIALTLLEDIVSGRISGASLALRAKYASAHLSRAGYGEVRKLHALHGHVTREELEKIKERALSAAQSVGMVIDVESIARD